MNDIAAPFRELVERRLWPLAVLLIAALVAIPIMLAKGGSTPPAPPAASASSEQGQTEPIVSLSEPGARDSVRKVLGSRKNPFRPAIAEKRVPVKKVSGTTAAAPAAADVTVKPAPSAPSAPSGPPAPAPTPVVTAPPTPTVVATPTPAPEKTYSMYELRVRFGDVLADTPKARPLKRLAALPGTDSPAVVYLGVLGDRKTAVFLVDEAVKVEGDGTCRPSTEDCQRLELEKGDSARLTTADGTKQFRLEMVKLAITKTTDAKLARKSYATVAKGGRDALRSRVGRVGGLVYDRDTGLLAKRG